MSSTSLDLKAAPGLWEKHVMAIDDVTNRLERIVQALNDAHVPHSLVGGNAVAMWVATKDPAAVRTTKDVDILLRREDLPRARAAALAVEMDYFEVLGVGMFLDRAHPNPRHAVPLLWAGERVRPEYPLPSPTVDEQETLEPGKHVVSLAGLVRMKLTSFRDKDRMHVRDMLEVGLVDASWVDRFPPELGQRLQHRNGQYKYEK